MAVRDDFAPGEVLAAADLNDTFDNLRDGLASKLDLAGGKILQIVRATDSTFRSTTSTSFVDANISVTITPQKSDSAIVLIWAANHAPQGTDGTRFQIARITDASDNGIAGATSAENGAAAVSNAYDYATIIGYATPAVTSSTTYKGQFRANGAGTTARLTNNNTTGQLYAIEVSA